MQPTRALRAVLWVFLVAVVLLLLLACGPAARLTPGVSAISAEATPEDRWAALLQRTPYPYTTPLPPPQPSALDGTYVKTDPKQATPFPCKRCPDYLPEGGLWKLHLSQGIFRIYYQVNGWRSIGSFTVSGDRLLLFNDPHCVDTLGRYTWQLDGGRLFLQVVEDDCSVGLRALNLTEMPWLSCQPPNAEAAITGHWQVPAGCEPGP